MRAVWGMALAGLLFASLLPAQTGFFQQIPGNLSQISVGADGTVWGVNAGDQIYTWDAQTSSWVNIPGSLAQIAVGSSSAVWGLNAQGQIYRWNGSGWVEPPVQLVPFGTKLGTLAQIAVGADGQVWAIDKRAHSLLLERQPLACGGFRLQFPVCGIGWGGLGYRHGGEGCEARSE
jgi:virginiamycin B lyase